MCNRGQNYSDTATGPEGPRTPPEAGTGRTGPLLDPLEGAQPCECLDFELLASRFVKEDTFVVLSHQGYGHLSW